LIVKKNNLETYLQEEIHNFRGQYVRNIKNLLADKVAFTKYLRKFRYKSYQNGWTKTTCSKRLKGRKAGSTG
jgi:hypothetical protein